MNYPIRTHLSFKCRGILNPSQLKVSTLNTIAHHLQCILLTWAMPHCSRVWHTSNTGYCHYSIPGCEQWTNATCSLTEEYFFIRICTYLKLSQRALGSCLPCWEKRTTCNILITPLFRTIFISHKKICSCLHGKWRISMTSIGSESRCVCVFWLTTQMHYMYLNVYL